MENDPRALFDTELKSLTDMINQVNGTCRIKSDENVSIILTDSYRRKRSFFSSLFRLFM